jgi:hypothetical protein
MVNGSYMMRSATILTTALVFCCLSLLPARPGLADVAPGDVIDKTNWEKAQGLLPESILGWVKDGKIALDIGQLSYDPHQCFPDYFLKGFEKNAGKYALDNEHWIVEVETGKRSEHVVGVPYPEIDPADPKAGEKVMYNNKYAQYSLGAARGEALVLLIGGTGYERTVGWEFLQTAMDGTPQSAGQANPDGLVKHQIIVVRSPYDLAGMATMTWRFRDPNKQDAVFGYAPSIRRVRRMSPANRSDSLFGSDVANDDAALYDGKMAAMEWRLLRRQDALIPFSDEVPTPLELNARREWVTNDRIKPAVYGFEKEGWQGAPWAPTNWVWAKCTTYVIEMKPKDRYYNYGLQHIWVSAEAFSPAYKIINDRSGKYWKTLVKARLVAESTDKTLRATILGDTIYIDERANHATLGRVATPEIVTTYSADLRVNIFSLAGFQKFCK